MKKTPLYDIHVGLGAKMVEYAGYLMPIYYKGIQAEHDEVRSNVGMFDVSHMGQIIVEGNDAYDYLNRVLSNKINYSSDNKLIYTFILNENGGIIDDLMVYPLSANKAMLVVNASNKDKDFTWLNKVVEKEDVKILDYSNYYNMIAIQGVNGAAIVNKLLGESFDDLAFMRFIEKPNYIISRSGYTGEDGFEIYANEEMIIDLFNEAIKLNVMPIGLGARDTLRFEASLPLYGNEMNEGIMPSEVGLMFGVNLNKEHFIGREKVFENHHNKTRKLVGIELQDRGILRAGYDLYNKDDELIGYVTTGYLLKGYEKSIGNGLVTISNKIGDEVYVDIRGRKLLANIINKRFLKKENK